MKYDFIYLLGDSFAFNDDVEEHYLFGNLIAKHYNLPLINKGVGGAGNNYIFRKSYKDCFDIEKGNPLVILVYTAYTRDEFFSHRFKRPVCISASDSFDKHFAKVYFDEHYDPIFLLQETIVKIKAIQTLLEHKKIDRIECFSLLGPEYWDEDLVSSINIDRNYLMDMDLCDKSRDHSFISIDLNGNEFKGHPTIEGNKIIADWMIEKIDSIFGNNFQ